MHTTQGSQPKNQKILETESQNRGQEMYSLLESLFPICRSITGNGLRQTLRILQEIIPLQIFEVPSGKRVFDWTVPDEWNICDAYVKNKAGKRIIDFKKSNLHVVGYSVPFEGCLTLEELKPHLYTLPEHPDVIPYATSYYQKTWGFCLPHSILLSMKDTVYQVKIDSILSPGSLTYGELFIQGQTQKEVLLSTYICHPSMANDNLSGPVIAAYLAKYLLESPEKPLLSHRILFLPETIGSIAYLSFHHEHLKNNVIAGYVLTCLGDSGPFSFLQTREENTLVDRVTLHVLKHKAKDFRIYSFLERGSDERQYASPKINLPIGSLMRTKYYEFPEYHSSADDLDFVSPENLNESLEMYKLCMYVLHHNRTFTTTVYCEPQLGKRGLYPQLSKKKTREMALNMLTSHIIAYCDGVHDLLWIADRINVPLWDLVPLAQKLLKSGLLEVSEKSY